MPRTYVITGAGSGVGAATVDLLREAGEIVVGVDLRSSDVTADLTTPEGRHGALADVLAATGGTVDAVIAVAGVALPSAITGLVDHDGTIELLEALRPTLAMSAAPRVVVVRSMASLQAYPPELVEALLTGAEAEAVAITERLADGPGTGSLIYAFTKRAVSRWVRAVAVPAWASAGIPLNVVAPGTVTTPMTTDLLSALEATTVDDALDLMPSSYHQPSESIANLLIWLASPENTHCAGRTIYCDGRGGVVLRARDAWAWADARGGENVDEVAAGQVAAEPQPVG